MSEMITKNHALVAEFGNSLDRLLDGIENFMANSRPTLGGERFLTDREVSARLKVSRRTLQDYRNNGIIAYYQLGGKILYKESDIERMLAANYKCLPPIIGKRSDGIHNLNKGNTTRRHQVVFLTLSGRISFVSTTWGFSYICRWRKEQI